MIAFRFRESQDSTSAGFRCETVRYSWSRKLNKRGHNPFESNASGDDERGSPGTLDIRVVQVSTGDPLFFVGERGRARVIRSRISIEELSRTRSSLGGIVANLELKLQPGLGRLPNLLGIEIAGVRLSGQLRWLFSSAAQVVTAWQ